MLQKYTYDQAYEASTKYFDGDELAAKVFVDKYALRNLDGEFLEDTPEKMHRRIAKEFASRSYSEISKIKLNDNLSEHGKRFFEKISKMTRSEYEDFIFSYFDKFNKICPQGRVMAGLGAKDSYRSLSNCLRLPPPKDSYSSIMYSDTMLVSAAKRGCGYGLGISNLRPSGASVKNSAQSSTGAISFMHRFSFSTREVAQSGRRGACLIDIDVRHPDTEAFIKIKEDKTLVTGANVSVKYTNDFFEKMANNKPFIQRFPIDADVSFINEEELEFDKLYNKNDILVRKINPIRLFDLTIKYARDNAEPGVFFWDRMINYDPASVYEEYQIDGTNACFVGKTQIAVADGRNSVSIDDLAKEGKDVAVYSINPLSGKVEIKMGRNPRKTRVNAEIVRVTLDNGSYLDVTPDHKFLLKNGEEKEAKNLVSGDSLFNFSKRSSAMSKISDSQYYRVADGISETFEHRLIAKFFKEEEWKEVYNKNKESGWLKGGLVVHHKDYDGLNNSPENLEIMTFKDHCSYHADCDRNGPDNGMWKDVSNEELERYAISLCEKLGRRFSQKEWQTFAEENGLIKSFSKYRRKGWFNTVKDLSIWAANELGFENTTEDPRLVKTLKSMLKQGYDAKIVDNKVLVKKNCEYSGEEFWVDHLKRNISFANQLNALAKRNKNKEFQANRIANSQAGHQKRAERNRENQAKTYSDLKFKLGRKPKIKEWELACKESGIPHRVGKKLKYNFKSYSEVCEAGESYNHKVVSVEKLVGKQDVFNITVDDNHTVGIITKKYINKVGSPCYSGIYTSQCGEQPMGILDTCRLILLNLPSFIKHPFTEKSKLDKKSLYDASYMQMFLGDILVDLEIDYVDRILEKINSDPEPEEEKAIEKKMWQEVKKIAKNGRRVGCGITGLGDAIAYAGFGYSSQDGLSLAETIMREKMSAELDCNIDLSILRGSFVGFSPEKEYPNSIPANDFFEFLVSEFPDKVKKMLKFGRRSINWSTIAPAGSASIETQTTSGCEPMFLPYYTRRVKVNPNDENQRIDFVDQNGDSWREEAVIHHGLLKIRKVENKDEAQKLFEESPYFNNTAQDIDWEKRVEMQSILQKYTTSAISTTLNLPSDVSYEEVHKIYIKSWELGLKGQTIYRDGCRTGVLVAQDKGIPKARPPKRPKDLPCEVHFPTWKGDKYYVVVGMMDGDPYEVFTNINEDENGDAIIPKSIQNGILHKKARSKYVLKNDEKEFSRLLTNGLSDDNADALTRLISWGLRSGGGIDFAVHQLEKTCGDLQSFAKVMARTLKKYVKDGTKVHGEECQNCGGELIRQEGCVSCRSCGTSKCG